MPVERQDYRNAMARLAAAVNVITTDGPAGPGGFTASAVCSVTDNPPMLLVCMNRSVSSCEAFRRNGVLCVNTLCASQQDISGVFAGMTGVEGAERFATGHWDKLSTGAPALQGAMVNFDTRVTDVVEKGTHLVFFCEIEAIRIGASAEPALLYFARNYRELAA